MEIAALLWTVRATNDFAYVAHLEDGIQILDIRTPNQVTAVGCFFGFHTTGGAEGVGRSATRTVVVAS